MANPLLSDPPVILKMQPSSPRPNLSPSTSSPNLWSTSFYQSLSSLSSCFIWVPFYGKAMLSIIMKWFINFNFFIFKEFFLKEAIFDLNESSLSKIFLSKKLRIGKLKEFWIILIFDNFKEKESHFGGYRIFLEFYVLFLRIVFLINKLIFLYKDLLGDTFLIKV